MNILSEPIVNYIINLYNIHYRIVISYLFIFFKLILNLTRIMQL